MEGIDAKLATNHSTTAPSITVLSENEIRRCVKLDHEAIHVVEDVFSRLAMGQAVVPPIMIIEVAEQHGEVDVKSAYVRGLDSFAVKIASGFSRNSLSGLPNSSGLMVVISAQTGFPLAVLLDNGYLTDVRTAAAGAVAAKYLAREKIVTVGVIGVGIQARYQLRALNLVRKFERVLVFGRNPSAVRQYSEEMTAEIGVTVEPSADPAALVQQSDVLLTTTPSKDTLVRQEWLHPGIHITAMGSDTPDKHELDPAVLVRADRIVCDLRTQCVCLGEIHHALETGVLLDTAIQTVSELGEIVSGRRQGRRSEREITVCVLTGVGVQDTAIARLAYHKAKSLGLGLHIRP